MGCAVSLAFVGLAVAFGLILTLRSRLRAAELRLAEVNALTRQLAELRRELLSLHQAVAPGAEPAAKGVTPEAVSPRPSVPASAPTGPPALKIALAPPAVPSLATAVVPPALVAPPLAAAATPAAASTPAIPSIPASPPAERQPISVPPPRPASAVPPPPPPPPKTPPASGPAGPPPARPARPAFDWEGLVGVRLFSWMAGIAFVLGAIFFLRYSIDRGLLGPPVRFALGALAGAGLIVLAELRVARRYAVTANALDGAGIAILFATFFAAHALWGLLGGVPAFALLVLVAAVAVALSIRRDSLFIALLGLLGGFATPALLSSGVDRPLALFGYLLLLNAGLGWVAIRRSWPVLSVLSLALTTFYQWGWVLRFLDATKLPLAAGIFLAFPLLALVLPRLARGGESSDRGRVGLWSAALPLLFALYVAAVPAYGARFGLLFGFLLVLDAGIAAVAAANPRGRLLQPLAAAGTLVVFAVWIGTSYGPDAWPGLLGFVAAFAMLYLAAPWVAARLGRPLAPEPSRSGTLAAPLLLFVFPVLVLIEPAAAAPGLLFGVLFLLVAATAARAIASDEGALHYVAAFFALAAQALWSAHYLTPERLLSALALYAVFGLFYLGVPLLARRLGRPLRPTLGAPLLLLASLLLLLFLAAGPAAASALWGIALLLLLLNAGLLWGSDAPEMNGQRTIALAGLALSWVVIAVWWVKAASAAVLLPALLVVAGLSVLALCGTVLPRRRQGGEGGGLSLALVGHLFLLFVASQASLAVPPWPLLGVLLVLDLALLAAALYVRRADLQGAALAASSGVLLVWTWVARTPPWPAVAVVASLVLAALALVAIPLARRRAAATAPGGTAKLLAPAFARQSAVGLFGAQAVLLAAALRPAAPGVPSLWLLAPAHLVLLSAILALAELAERPGWAPWSVVGTALVSFCWVAEHQSAPVNWHDLLFAGILYGAYLAYPLVLGQRARNRREPYLAAVLASVPFFLVALGTLRAGGLGGIVGLLPLAQGAALAILLRQLLGFRRQAAGEGGETGRLALVAGAVLAAATVALPLQLEKQWLTIGWALLAAALAWLYGRVAHRGLLLWTAGLSAAVFVRLAVNPAVLSYHPRGTLPIWNWYLYTYLVAALALLAAARWLRPTDDRLAPLSAAPRVSSLLAAGAVVLLFLLLNVEIADFFSTGSSLTFGFLTGHAGLAEDLASTLGWCLFALALLIAGIVARSRPTRVAAIALLLAAAFKGLFHDLWRQGGLYRVGSFLGLAVCLATVAILIQRFVLAADEEPPA